MIYNPSEEKDDRQRHAKKKTLVGSIRQWGLPIIRTLLQTVSIKDNSKKKGENEHHSATESLSLQLYSRRSWG